MTPGTARILVQALQTQRVTLDAMFRLAKIESAMTEAPGRVTETLVALAETYVHEQRIINRIIHEATDD